MKTRNVRHWNLAGAAGAALLVCGMLTPAAQGQVPFQLRLNVQNTETNRGSITAPTNVPPRMPTGVWIPVGSEIEVVAQANPGYAFDRWQVDTASTMYFESGADSPATFVQCLSGVTNVTLTARFKLQDVSLTVISTNNWGAPLTPAIGVSTWSNGANVSASATTPVVLGGGAQAICTGYVGSGSVPASGTMPSVSFQITTNSTLTWLWRIQSDTYPLTIISTNSNGYPVGNPSPRAGVTNVANGASISCQVTSPFYVSADERVIVDGYTGTGSAPSGLGSPTAAFYMLSDSSVRWNWRSEYLLRVEIDGDGAVARTPGGTPQGTPIVEGWWYPAGTSVGLKATPVAGFFLGWGGDVSGFTPTNVVVMNGPRTVNAVFGTASLDSDHDGLPDDWEVRFGLDPYGATGVSGAYGDPDNDGLSNLQEYQVTHVYHTNLAAYAECSPIDADSDNDGLDDGYEFYNILFPGNSNAVAGSQANYLAPVDPRGANGPDGNPDRDYHWNTATGFRTTIGLTTAEEYIGPDGNPPGVWEPSVAVPGVALAVRRYRDINDPLFPTDTGDTGDQSSSDSTDSEYDGFDDGFEYSWDVWQSEHAGEPAGDPLGQLVPLRFGNVAARPMAAVLAPWFTNLNCMAVASFNYNQVNFFVNIGAGAFAPVSTVPVGTNPVAMALGRFDAGTANDIVTANQGDNTISVLLWTPTNVVPFTVSHYAVGSRPSSVAVGEFNGDANQDIAVANAGDGTVTILTNNGAGAFSQMTSVTVGGVPASLAAGHVFSGVSGGSAFDDLLVADGVTNVVTLRNLTTGTFSNSGSTVVGDKPSSVVMTDISADNTNDFAVALAGESKVKTYRGNGDGTFAYRSEATAGSPGYPVHLALGAIDAGSAPDLVASAYSNETGYVFLGAAGGALSPAAPIALGMRPIWSVIGDVTGDGINDVLFVCPEDDKVLVWRGVGDGSFTYQGSSAASILSVGRPFSPGKVHEPPPGDGFPDYDLVYLEDGGVGNWWSDQDEYNAWTTTRESYFVGAVTNTIIGGSAAMPRCTHPFLWDADGDGLPDGWEVQFGYDPWKKVSFGGAVTDARLNPDLDGHAVLTNGAVILQDNAVYSNQWLYPNFDPYPPTGYAYKNFNPNAAWMDPLVVLRNPPRVDQTEAFNNRLEMLGGRTRPAIIPFDPEDKSSNPKRRDTDRDGVWDGWELYTGMNPINPTDVYVDNDKDGLSAWQEFMCLDTLVAEPSWTIDADGVLTIPGALTPAQVTLISQRVQFVAGWRNKTRPTDPNDPDTDDDQILDGREMGIFNYSGSSPATPVFVVDYKLMEDQTVFYAGGGLCPTACDTDMDRLPDRWEAAYRGGFDADSVWGGGMDATVEDAFLDYDGDGLLNYQEYMAGANYGWQAYYNDGSPAWVFGRGLNGYEPFDFFDERLSCTPDHANGDNETGPGGRRPKYWDAHFYNVISIKVTPFNFMTAVGGVFSTTDPGNRDSDGDGMDDYWEVYHMLNPIAGGGLDLSTVKVGGTAPDLPYPVIVPLGSGSEFADPDQDGLPNIYESIQPQTPLPAYYHTDPSPYWVSDLSDPNSWANLYYWSGNRFGIHSWWYWGLSAPDYVYDFEINEGFDTDNDNLGDRAELVDTSASPGSTDPLDSGDPIKRRALYLNGQAAARTYGPTTYNMWDQLREFTVEAWVRPQNPASGTEQVIVDRPQYVPNGNILGYPSGIRANFRLGLDPDGKPFIGYHGGGYDPIFEEAKAGPSGALTANQWAHLAGVFDARQKKLFLYVNGVMAAMKSTAEIPFNMWYGGSPSNTVIYNNPAFIPAPLIIGARDGNPPGWEDGYPLLVTASAGLYAGGYLEPKYPQLDHHFIGWVDEVHVFSGPTPQSTIQNRMMRRWTQKTVQQYNAAAFGTNALLWAYSFDDIQDPDHGDVAPAGFNLLSGFMPGYVGINWWRTAPDVSRVYTDYRYVPWIDNLVDHVAMSPALDSTIVYSAESNAFPNTSNPYGWSYKSAPEWFDQFHPRLLGSASAPGDMLPLGWAVADQDVVMWDSLSGGNFDTDGDGMSDDWETAHGLDPRNATGDDGAEGDADGDGLSNWNEYLSNTDPWSVDSDGDRTWDGDEDSDGDGLSNDEEILVYATNPGDPDTDDDGVSDGDEVNRQITKADGRTLTGPLDSRSPLLYKSMVANGVPVLAPARSKFDDSDRFNLKNWTVEGWIKPATTNENGALVLRRLHDGRTNFAVRLESNYPVVEFTSVAGVPWTLKAFQPVSTSAWTHLAGVYSSDSLQLTLYVNGTAVTNITATDSCATGDGLTTLGDGLFGGIDDVRIWSVARDAAMIAQGMGSTYAESQRNISDTITVTTPTNNPATTLWNALLAGALPAGVEVMSVTVSGSPDAMGVYEGFPVLPDNMPRPGQGVILSSGKAKDAEGIVNAEAGLTTAFGTPGDTRLTTLADDDTYDAALLTVTFRSGISVKGVTFDFLFASEEFPEFVNTIFNDDFAAFLDGENIAFDRSGKPICVNNNFFELNNDIWSPNDPDIVGKQKVDLPFEYDGLTPMLTTSKALQPGVHTLTFAIADTGDQILDSIVFLSRLRFTLEEEGTVRGWPDMRAQYLFDDGQNTTVTNKITGYVTGHGAEDFSRPLDWNLAIKGCIFNSADYVTPLVDGQSDGDSDGMADWYEQFFFGGDLDPLGDSDGDGLNNLYEYLTDNDPLDADTNGNLVPDGAEDFDHDALSNMQEQRMGSRPDLRDTDDDGVADGVEAGTQASPANALTPLADRVLQVNGGYVEMPSAQRFSQTNWTLGAWVQLNSLTDATVIGRQMENGVWNYALRLGSAGQVVAMFTPGDRTADVAVTSTVAVATGVWTHVASSFNASNRMLAVYVNGVQCGAMITAKQPAMSGVGAVWTRVGAGMDGMIDEVGIYSASLSATALQGTMDGIGMRSNALVVCYYRFDDGTSATNNGAGVWVGTSGNPAWTRGQVQDFADGVRRDDWNTGWHDAGTLVGGAAMVPAPAGAPVLFAERDTDGDGMPDGWELANGLDPHDATGDNGAAGDPDGDGLSNWNEYLCGTDPWSVDSDGDNIWDADADSDGDGLSNIDEVTIYLTDPGAWDTDDDGISDGDEVNGSILKHGRRATSPLYSRDPLVPRSMQMTGSGVIVPEPVSANANGRLSQRFDSLYQWAAGCWVKLPSNETGTLIYRRLDTGYTNLILSLVGNVPHVEYTGTDKIGYSLDGSFALPTNQWVAVLAVLDPLQGSLSLYIDDVLMARRIVTARCMAGMGVTYAGVGLTGWMDDLYIGDKVWAPAGSGADIAFVLDASGSMYGQPLADVKTAAKAAIDAMPAGSMAEIIQLQTTATMVQPFTADKTALKAAVDGIQSGDSTGYIPALEMLANSYSNRPSERARVALFLSDGYPDESPSDAVIASVANAKIVVNTIGFGVAIGSNPVDLTRIAQGTGGQYYPALTTDDLKAIMGGVVTIQSGNVAAFYPFDDAGQTAEDFVSPLNWSLAIKNVVFDSTQHNDSVCAFNWMFTDMSTRLPKWWNLYFFGEETVAATDDPDLDGFDNLNEYILGLNPGVADTDGNMVIDGNEDTDGDGILNRDEMVYATKANDPDTDDDGFTDGAEVNGSISKNGVSSPSPVYSRSPLIARSLVMNGTAVELPEPLKIDFDVGYHAQRFQNLSSWVIGCIVRPATAAETGSLVKRTTIAGQTQFELRLSNNVPSIRFSTPSGTNYSVSATSALLPNEWAVLMATWMPSNQALNLYVDYAVNTATGVVGECATGPGLTVIGEGVSGLMDDLYISDRLPPPAEETISDYALVLDCSGSMDGDSLMQLQDACHQMIDILPDESQMAIVSFDSEATLRQTFTSDKVLLGDAIDALVANDGTEYTPALKLLNTIYSTRPAERKRVAIFVSDGAPATSPSGAVLTALKKAGIIVHAVGINTYGYDTELKRIASTTGGTFVNAPTADQLAEIMLGLLEKTQKSFDYAYYPFDDGGKSAEDFNHQLDWEYAITPFAYTNIGAGITTPFNWLHDDSLDALPAWWKSFFKLGAGTDATTDDPDGDGLNNLYEYLCGTSPVDTDSDHDAIPDGLEDADHDGLNNIDEQTAKTLPMVPDTDDDGISDGADVSSRTAATDALAPLVDRVLSLDGSSNTWVESVRMRDIPLSSWTVEAWVKPTAIGTPVTLIGRQVEAGVWNYRLGLDAGGHAVAEFTSSDLTRLAGVTSVTAVAAGEWTHLAASLDASNNVLAVYINGGVDGLLTTALAPALVGKGPMFMRVGQGFSGALDEVLVYGKPLTADGIRLDMKGYATHAADTNSVQPVSYFRFDDGTNPSGTSGNPAWLAGQVQDFSLSAGTTDWIRRWANSGTLRGGALMVAAPGDAPVLYTKMDSDDDGLPDVWEIAHGLNPKVPTGVNGASGDPDGDGLSNLYEYRAGTDPNNPDSDHNGVQDGDEDADGDGLSNAEEQQLGTMPGMKDTDDDGVTDWEEVTGEIDFSYARPLTSLPPKGPSDPLDPLSPQMQRCVSLDGSGRVIVPPSDKLMSKNWSVEMWICPATNAGGSVLASRYVGGLYAGQSGINYEMGLETNAAAAGTLRPYIRYALTTNFVERQVKLDGLGGTDVTNSLRGLLVTNNVWTHLAGVYDYTNSTLSLYVNGQLATYRTDATLTPPTVFGSQKGHFRDEVTLGASRSTGVVTGGYRGLMDEVRIWNVALTARDIADRYNAPEVVKVEVTGGIELKNGTVSTVGGLTVGLASLGENDTARVLVKFDTAADASDTTALGAAGVVPLYYVAPEVRVVKATKSQLASLGAMVQWGGVLKAADKVSARVGTAAGARNVLVQFYPDVAQATALTVVQNANATAYQSRYLAATYMAVNATDAQIGVLAANDAVAWIMPAADYLTSGAPVRLLPDALVHGLPVAPFTARSVGWDGPGLGSASLNYCFDNDTAKMPTAQARQAVRDQMARWAAVAALTFTETTTKNTSKSIDIGWYSGDHGDGFPFDGPFGVLAHAYYPDDINPEPIAGDLHFDEAESWNAGVSNGTINIEEVALHELGHSLGLGHSDDPTAVMYPFYHGTQTMTLQPDDIAGIQSIYGAVSTNTPPPPGPPRPWSPKYGPQNVSLFRFDDGGLSAQDFSLAEDWLNGWASAARFDGGAAFHTNSTPFLGKDTDGDGMPDAWELANGLDPYDATGDNGAYGDPDSDGLANLYEYHAGTDPWMFDTDGDGFSDYDSRMGPGYRTYGEIWDDGDGIADEWEILYPGPCAANGNRGLDPAYYDANLDPDQDGWDNYAEFMSDTDPLDASKHPTPSVAVHVRYVGRLGASIDEALVGGNIVMNFYHTPAMDGYADASLTMNQGYMVVSNFTSGYIHGGNNYIFGFLDVNANGTWEPATEPAGIAQFQPINIGWGAINNVEIGLTDSMPGYPRVSWPAAEGASKYIITVGSPAITRTMMAPRNYWHEGDWLAAGYYGGGIGVKVMMIYTNDTLGYYTNYNPSIPSVSLATPVIMTAHDTEYVYARNEIEFRRDTNATAYRLQIALSSNGTPVVTYTNVVPYADINGVSKAALPIYAGDNYVPTNGVYASSVWTNGRYWVRAQAFTIATTSQYSAWSAINFNLQTPAAGGKSMIGGDVYYFGKVSRGYGAGQTNNLTVIVQAFESPGFSGVPDAQVQISYSCNTNAPSAKKGDYALKGLANKPYYVLAFIDINGNRTLDSWEPMGFAREPATGTAYQPLAVDLSGQAGVAVENIRVVIRDRDTDNGGGDGLPDGWEWMYFGTLARGGNDTATNGLTLLRNYEIEPFDLDPTKTDYDGDGLHDRFEITYSDFVKARATNSSLTVDAWMASGLGDVSHYDPYDPVLNPRGTDLNPTKVDTDGDGLPDGYELANGLDPLDPNGDADGDGVSDAQEVLVTRTSPALAEDVLKVRQVAAVEPGSGVFSLTWTGKAGATYQVQYSDDLKTWHDAPVGVRSGVGDHVYVEQSPAVSVRFYRVVAK